MNTFYTLTDKNTEYTNSRSQRFATLEQAREAAKQRIVRAIESGELHRGELHRGELHRGEASRSGVYILRAVEFLEPETPVVPPIRTTTLVSPLPPDLGSEYALGHNPAGLTNKQVGVGDGWRLLDADEISDYKWSTVCDAWRNPEGWLAEKGRAWCKLTTYRTKFTREELRATRYYD